MSEQAALATEVLDICRDARLTLAVAESCTGGLIAATLSYFPAFFPIWGNKNTFSWEPFLERTVFRGQTLRWSIEYEF